MSVPNSKFQILNFIQKIFCFECDEWEKDYLVLQMPEWEVVATTARLLPDNVAEYKEAEIIATFMRSDLSAAVLAQLPNLKCVLTRSTGYDHINLAYCCEHQITVCNVPGYGEHSVAEHSFALLLTISRKIVESFERTERGDFDRSGLRGFDLFGRTLGVLGFGRIGQAVARIGLGFGMKVLAYDVKPNVEAAVKLGVEFKPLEEILATADVITLHAPASADNIHLLNKKTISQMKKGVYIINTARGTLIETKALLEALKSGQVAGAGLDVLEEENPLMDEMNLLTGENPAHIDWQVLLQDHALIETPNVIITPHNAFNSQESLQLILRVTADNAKNFVAGSPINVVL